MDIQIKSALISVYYKDKLEILLETLQKNNITIYSTGGTQQFIESKGYTCIAVDNVTDYPHILGGRVKTLHPKIFGGILARRNNETDIAEMLQYQIPAIDLVIVDLYPFEETVANTTIENEIIEKIDIGGPSMIRAAAKNFKFTTVIASKDDYQVLSEMLERQHGTIQEQQRRYFAAKAFEVVKKYDIAIADYFLNNKTPLRYGENPHQKAYFKGDLSAIFHQLHGKELSYNNLVDCDAALQLSNEFSHQDGHFFAIFKHTNVCGAALHNTLLNAWQMAFAGDPESAFGGVLVTNSVIDKVVATEISEIFFEVLIADAFTQEALEILQKKKNRILLEKKSTYKNLSMSKTILNGELVQESDTTNIQDWNETGGVESNEEQKKNMAFANILCKHLKSNAIALVKEMHLVGKGCGQTSRIDALRQAIDKAKQFDVELNGAVLASDAFFPFDDCVKIAHQAGINAFIQPGGSIRDNDSIQYCKENKLCMVLTAMRHFKH